MNYNHEKGPSELSNEGTTIQCYLLSSKYPNITIGLPKVSAWRKIWNWIVG